MDASQSTFLIGILRPKRSHTVTSFEPFTLLSALSQVTDHIGLVATGSTISKLHRD
jgi:alkanesulfonate monooxygenase SsuD/methylene tetrahydromethanopterin reductase-like flavin-dependent oxidoreductase (luciferase family)